MSELLLTLVKILLNNKLKQNWVLQVLILSPVVDFSAHNIYYFA